MNTTLMTKAEAIKRLGGSAASAAKAVGISVQAVSGWPDPLTNAIADRVIAAQVREMGVIPPPEPAPADASHA